MRHDFTPAAERALAIAARWVRRDATDSDLGPPEVLLGLLAEPECRAAIMLARHGIDAAAVQARWPELELRKSSARRRDSRFSTALEVALGEAEIRLSDYSPPLSLATEHLLLGLLAADDESSAWLQERGVQLMEIEGEIHRLYGHVSDALPAELPSGEPSRPIGTDAIVLDAKPEATASGPLSAHLYRLLDAAANRAGEALRVIDDYVRFVLDDRHLTTVAKELRHALKTTLEPIAAELRLASRDTPHDIGTQISTPGEKRRRDVLEVAAANFNRLQQALRSLEEYGKVLDPQLGASLEAIRYRSYTFERAVATTRRGIERLSGVRLYVLVDGRESPDDFERLVASLVAAGVDALQLRDKKLDDRTLIDRARTLRRLTAAAPALFIMNDRPDLAALADADGVHVGQEELSVRDARAIVGPERLVGVSTHSIEQARQAVIDGADYIGVGPTFPSTTKPFDHYTGVELLRAVAKEIRLPSLAVGGINHDNVREVLAAGIGRIAVAGAIVDASDPAAAGAELRAILNRNNDSTRPRAIGAD